MTKKCRLGILLALWGFILEPLPREIVGDTIAFITAYLPSMLIVIGCGLFLLGGND